MKIRIDLELDRETKNTVRYKELGNTQKLYAGVIYIRKEAFDAGRYPKELQLTVVERARLDVVQ